MYFFLKKDCFFRKYDDIGYITRPALSLDEVVNELKKINEEMKELDVVRLTKEFEGLPIGTEGTIVCEYDGKAFEVEFFDNDGDTIDVFTTPVEVIELLIEYK